MITKLFESQNYNKIDFTVIPLEKAEYDHCNFSNCNFYESDISDITFSTCLFEDCDFSLARCMNANCLIRISSFYKLKLKKTRFIGCNLQEADFTDSDLSGALFDNCDLQGALFENTNLERADLYSSYHYSIDPEKNRLRKARFSKSEITGLLDKYDIEIL